MHRRKTTFKWKLHLWSCSIKELSVNLFWIGFCKFSKWKKNHEIYKQNFFFLSRNFEILTNTQAAKTTKFREISFVNWRNENIFSVESLFSSFFYLDDQSFRLQFSRFRINIFRSGTHLSKTCPYFGKFSLKLLFAKS